MAAPGNLDSVRAASRTRALRAGERADTLVVVPGTLSLRVGDSVNVFERFTLQARDAAGVEVPGVRPLIETDGGVRMRGLYLVGVSPGAGALVLRPMRTGLLEEGPFGRPVTRVPITVAPR